MLYQLKFILPSTKEFNFLCSFHVASRVWLLFSLAFIVEYVYETDEHEQ